MSTITGSELLPVSADAHVNEPHDLWYERLPVDMRDSAPRRIERQSDGGWTLVVNGDPMGWQTVSAAQAAVLEAERIGHATPDVRLRMLAEEGIGGEVIYPTIGLYMWDLRDPAVGKAACSVYNDWIHERLGSEPSRIKLAGMIPTWDMDDAVGEVHRIAAKGFAAAMLPLVGTPPWNDPLYEPLWDAIEEAGLAVAMHQGTGQGETGGGVVYRGPGSPAANILTAQTQAPRTAALLACSGVLERHPDLHVVLVEVNGGWVAWCMSMLDEFARANPVWTKPRLPELPSHYIARQIHCTFQNDPVAIANLPITGPRTILWGNDYPHDEGTYPHSQEVIDELFRHVSAEDRARVLAGNAIEIFGFDPKVVATPVTA
jgi:predicted TIM-barrel fold metal-dependent hydrolase